MPRLLFAGACLWEAAQILSNGPWTFSALLVHLKGSEAGRWALRGLSVAAGLALWEHLEHYGD